MRNSKRLTGILVLVIGVILLVCPGGTLETFCRLLGWLLVAGGILEIIIGFIEPRAYANIAGGIVAILLGIFFVVRPDMIISFLPFSVGLITALGGVSFLVWNLVEKNSGPVAAASITGSIIAVVAGIILMLNAYETAKLLMVILGLFLMYIGILQIIRSFD